MEWRGRSCMGDRALAHVPAPAAPPDPPPVPSSPLHPLPPLRLPSPPQPSSPAPTWRAVHGGAQRPPHGAGVGARAHAARRRQAGGNGGELGGLTQDEAPQRARHKGRQHGPHAGWQGKGGGGGRGGEACDWGSERPPLHVRVHARNPPSPPLLLPTHARSPEARARQAASSDAVRTSATARLAGAPSYDHGRACPSRPLPLPAAPSCRALPAAAPLPAASSSSSTSGWGGSTPPVAHPPAPPSCSPFSLLLLLRCCRGGRLGDAPPASLPSQSCSASSGSCSPGGAVAPPLVAGGGGGSRGSPGAAGEAPSLGVCSRLLLVLPARPWVKGEASCVSGTEEAGEANPQASGGVPAAAEEEGVAAAGDASSPAVCGVAARLSASARLTPRGAVITASSSPGAACGWVGAS